MPDKQDNKEAQDAPLQPAAGPSLSSGLDYDNLGTIDRTRQQASTANPMHASVTTGAKKTPLEVQLGLTLLPARYILRAFAKSAHDGASPSFFSKISGAHSMREVFADNLFKKIEARLQEFEPHAKNLFNGQSNSLYEITEKLENYEYNGQHPGRQLTDDVAKMLRQWDAGSHAENTVQHYIRAGRTGITPKSIRKIKGSMSEPVFEMMYDTMLGVGSYVYTRKVQSNVHTDIMSLYREAVSFETGKDPHKMDDDDIVASDNEIINQTVKNYRNRRAYRYGISALPLLKLTPNVGPLKGFSAMQWGEVAIGAWGFLWAFDIWGRTPTMLETFRSFVNDKLNPLYGIGDPVKPSEVIDLYQQYAYRFSPEIAFRSISVNDEDANRMWADSEKMFARMSDLMNESYNFKHRTELDPNTNTPIVKADFTLPKFIYLLGHGLINARKPEWSMAFVELANKFPDMEAVKDAANIYRNNGNLSDVIEKYDIDLNHEMTPHHHGLSYKQMPLKKPTSQAAEPEGEAPNKPETTAQQPAKDTAKEGKPRTKIDTSVLEAANLDHAPAPEKQPARA